MEDAGRSLLDVINDPDALNLFLESPGDGEVSTSNGLCELDSLSPLLGTDPWSPTGGATSSLPASSAPAYSMPTMATSTMGVAPSPTPQLGTFRHTPSPLATSRTSSPVGGTQQSLSQSQVIQTSSHLGLTMAPHQQQPTLGTTPQVALSQHQQIALGQTTSVSMATTPQHRGTVTLGLGQQFIQSPQQILPHQITLASAANTATSNIQQVALQNTLVQNVQTLNLNQMQPITSTLQIRPQGGAPVAQVSVPGQVSLQGTIIQTSSGNRILIQGQPLLQGQPINIAALQNLHQLQLRAPGIPVSQAAMLGQTPIQPQPTINIAPANTQPVNSVSASITGSSIGVQQAKVSAPIVSQAGVNLVNLSQAHSQQIMIQRPVGSTAAPNQNIILRALPSNLILQAPGTQQPQTQLLVGHAAPLQPGAPTGQIQIQPAVTATSAAASTTPTSTPTQLSAQQVQTITGQVLGMPVQGLNLQQPIKPTQTQTSIQGQNITLQSLTNSSMMGPAGNTNQSIQIQAQNVNIQGRNVNLLTQNNASTLQKGLLKGTIKVNVGGQNLTLQQIKQLGLPQLKGLNLLAGGGVGGSPVQGQIGVASSQPQVLLPNHGQMAGQTLAAQPTLIQGPGGIQQIILQPAQSTLPGQPPMVQQIQVPQPQPPMVSSQSDLIYQSLVKEEKPTSPSPPPPEDDSEPSSPVTSGPYNFDCILSAAAAQSGIVDLLTPAENNVSVPQASATGATISYKPAKPVGELSVPTSPASSQPNLLPQSIQAPPNVNIQQVQLNNLMPTVNTVGPPNAVAPTGIQIIPKVSQNNTGATTAAAIQQKPTVPTAFQTIPASSSSSAALPMSLSAPRITQAASNINAPLVTTNIHTTMPSIALSQMSPNMPSSQVVTTAAQSTSTFPQSSTPQTRSTPTPEQIVHPPAPQPVAVASPLPTVKPGLMGAAPQVQAIQLTVANQQMLAKIQQEIKGLMAIPKRTEEQQKLLQQCAELQKHILIQGRNQALQTQQQQLQQQQQQQQQPQQQQRAPNQSIPDQAIPVQQQHQPAIQQHQISSTQKPQQASSTQTAAVNQAVVAGSPQQQQVAAPQQVRGTSPAPTPAVRPIMPAVQTLNSVPQPQQAPSPPPPQLVQNSQPQIQTQQLLQTSQAQTQIQTQQVIQNVHAQTQLLQTTQSQVQTQHIQLTQSQVQQFLQQRQQQGSVVQIVPQDPANTDSTKQTILVTAPAAAQGQRMLAPNLPKVLPNVAPKSKLSAAAANKTQIHVFTTTSPTAATTTTQKLIQIKPLVPGQIKPTEVKLTSASQPSGAQVLTITSGAVPSAGGKVLLASTPSSTVGPAPGTQLKISQIAIPTALKDKLLNCLSRLTPEQQQEFLKNPQALILKKLQQAQLAKQQQLAQQAKAGISKPLVANASNTDVKPAKPQAITKTSFIMSQLARDQKEATKPDTKLAFKNRKDACKRLLRFHVCQDHFEDLAQEARDDDQFELMSQELLKKKQQMLSKYRLLLFDEAGRIEPTSEMVMLQRMFLNDERKILEADRKMAKEDPDSFVPKPILTVDSSSEPSSPITSQAALDTETTPSPSSSPQHLSSSSPPSLSPVLHNTSSSSYSRGDLKRKLGSCWEERGDGDGVVTTSYTLHSSGGLKLVFKNSPMHLASPTYTPPNIVKNEDSEEEIFNKKPKIKEEVKLDQSWEEQESKIKSEPSSPELSNQHGDVEDWGPGPPDSNDNSWDAGAMQNGVDGTSLDFFMDDEPHDPPSSYTNQSEPYSINQSVSHEDGVTYQVFSSNRGQSQHGAPSAESSINMMDDMEHSEGANHTEDGSSLLDTSQGDLSEEDSAVAGLLGGFRQSQDYVQYSGATTTTADYSQSSKVVTSVSETNFNLDVDHSVNHDHPRTSRFPHPHPQARGSEGVGRQQQQQGDSGVRGGMLESLMEGSWSVSDVGHQSEKGNLSVSFMDSEDDDDDITEVPAVNYSPSEFLNSSEQSISFDEDNLNVEMQSAINSILSLQTPAGVSSRRASTRRQDSNTLYGAMGDANPTPITSSTPGMVVYEDVSDADTSSQTDDLDAAVQSILM